MEINLDQIAILSSIAFDIVIIGFTIFIFHIYVQRCNEYYFPHGTEPRILGIINYKIIHRIIFLLLISTTILTNIFLINII